jgi:V/A-type H+/Na+-transporting ATPase subunit E
LYFLPRKAIFGPQPKYNTNPALKKANDMEAKLQELTSKIYEEGVARARREAESILTEAREQAEHLLTEARREAEHTRAKAKEDAEDLRRNLNSELQLSARQALSGLKQETTNLIMTRLLHEPLRETFHDPAFLQRIIESAIKNWDASNGQADLALLLPEKERKTLEEHFANSLSALLKEGDLTVNFDQRLQQGFRIGPADGRYLLSFTPADFERFFRLYLRPLAMKLLFEENQAEG